MIEEWNDDRTGYAQFSDDRTMRYSLARSFTPFSHQVERMQGAPRCVFVMMNPSTADAFKPDRTVSRCAEWAKRWGCDVFEVVNLFALRSPYPVDVYRAAQLAMPTGANLTNDDAIVAACERAKRVIAAWGNHGRLMDRDLHVRELLSRAGVKLEALRILPNGIPSHPLARGRNWIPYDIEPVVFA